MISLDHNRCNPEQKLQSTHCSEPAHQPGNNLTTRAREGKTQPAEMANGTLTITNIGSLGIDTGTPIINPGEVAIVAFGTIKQKPWVVDGEVIPRWVTTLGGSFDHRVVDGDLSARFMADVAAILEEPAMLLDM